MIKKRLPIVSDQVSASEIATIVQNLETIIQQHIPGHAVEFGCYVGTSSLFIQQTIVEQDSSRQFHVYDSFAGLPAKTSEDESPAGTQFRAGELHAAKAVFVRNFQQQHVPLPHIHKAWFEKLTANDLPDPIAFAFLDGDFYHSIAVSLRLITPRLSKGACIIVDDYQSSALPGAARAVDEWIERHPHSRLRTEHSLAVISFRD